MEIKKEYDPTGKSPNQPGAKLDAGKSALFQGLLAYFPRACEQVAAVSTFGATKYTWKGWESVPRGVERYSDALVRHLTREGAGEVKDPDTDFHHAAHVAWNALARLELMLKEKENAIQSTTSLIGPVPSAVLGNSQMGQTMAQDAISRYAEFSKCASPPGHLIGGQQCGLRLQNCATDYPEHLKAVNMLVGDNE